MTTDVEKLYQAALKLSGNERYYLASLLMESVEAERDPDYEEAWKAEIARRIEEIDQGTVTLIPWEEVKRMIHNVRYGS